MLRTKRIYDPAAPEDGVRMLIMRMWPRGVRKERVHEWNRDLAPSKALVMAFKKEGLPWEAYVARFWAEIRPEAIEALRERARRETITLLCACEEESRCHRGLIKARIASLDGAGRPRGRGRK